MGEGDDRRWDGWMASLTQWTWVWVNSGSWQWTRRPGVLQSMGSQRVGHDWATELNWWSYYRFLVFCLFSEGSFSSCCKAGLEVLNLLNFSLSGKLLISSSNLKESLAGYSILGCRFFSFITLNTSCHSLLASRVSVEKSADSLMGVPLYVICCFPLVAFNILYLS